MDRKEEFVEILQACTTFGMILPYALSHNVQCSYSSRFFFSSSVQPTSTTFFVYLYPFWYGIFPFDEDLNTKYRLQPLFVLWILLNHLFGFHFNLFLMEIIDMDLCVLCESLAPTTCGLAKIIFDSQIHNQRNVIFTKFIFKWELMQRWVMYALLFIANRIMYQQHNINICKFIGS